jgi:bifunctional aspartokinase / homoserine dehydrogenase 1
MRDKIRVIKFGGTSVRDADCIQGATRIIADDAWRGPVVTVVSAMGGVTNRLIEAAHQSATGDEKCATELADWLLHQHTLAIHQLVRDEDTRQQLIDETIRPP